MKKTLKIGYKNKDFYIKESENCSEELKQDFLKYLKERKKSLINCAYDLNSVVFEINNHSKRIKNRVLKHKNKQIVCYYDYFRDHSETLPALKMLRISQARVLSFVNQDPDCSEKHSVYLDFSTL